MKPTLVLVAHGTRDPAGVALLADLAEAVAARSRLRVRLAFADVLGPSVAQTLSTTVGPAIVVPAFLSSGYHVRTDIPAQLLLGRRPRTPVTEPFGPDPRLAAVLAQRLGEAGRRPGDAIVLAAAGSSDPDARAEVHTVAGLLRDRLGGPGAGPITVAYAATAEPAVDDAVAALRAAGHRRVAVASWLLAPGLFQRRLHASGADAVASPLGLHPFVVDILLERYQAELSRLRADRTSPAVP
ncbi:sirohydrochlorin chelatase [Allonocardiopsis opalescens]|uniref:Sirohydrochlorin ferrochelatase n=1 Tax=Allonocardiopsis opalescens TaxID=1144618 RepID=A0A2T0PXJ0_9ACTN|nr:sirohydrochlorin chelatase [Allonocardiopsis opalescens]PRX96251.1 sirohydrochlorin ferrochelatase [Allonocardiopsis opalescens]